MELFSDIPTFVDRFSYLGILMSLILGAVGFPFPEDAVLISSGFLIAHKLLSPVPALVVVFAGMLISDLIIFSLGMRFGRRIVTHKWFGRIISSDRLTLIERRFSSYGSWAILFGRQLFGIRAQIILMSGIARMRILRFLTADALAALVTMGIMVTAGYFGGQAADSIKGIMNNMSMTLLTITAAALIIVGFVFLKNRFLVGTGD